MKFILVSCLTGLYLLAYTTNMRGFSVFILSVMILFALFNILRKKSKNITTIIVELMCYCIPISWRNIFGGSFADIPLPWFYILGGLLIVILMFIKIKKAKTSGYGRLLVEIVTFTLILLGIIPLLITKRDFFHESMGQFITLTFYNIILFFSIVKGPLIDSLEVNKIRNAYTLSGFVTSLGIIIQFFTHRFIGITLGNIEYALNRILYGFMFIDISSGTLYLASTAFMTIIFADKYMNRKISSYIQAIVIIIATAITSSRTGGVAFFITLGIYLLFKKGVFKKFLGVVVGGMFLLTSLYFFNIVRPMDNISAYVLNSSGRMNGYLVAIKIFMENPLLGTGFSRTYTSFLMGGMPLPHFSILQYLVQTGLVYTGMIFGVILYAQILAIKKSFLEGWILLLTIIGSCFIPDIFSSRFIIVVLITIFIQENHSKKVIRTLELI